MGLINHDPSLEKYINNFSSRIQKLETAKRFTIPNVTADPPAPLHGDIWLNTTTNTIKYVDSTGAIQTLGGGGTGIFVRTQLINGMVNYAITTSVAWTIGGITGSVSYAISPSVAGTGLSFSTSTGRLSGTPTSTINTTYTVTATGSISGTGTGYFQVLIVAEIYGGVILVNASDSVVYIPVILASTGVSTNIYSNDPQTSSETITSISSLSVSDGTPVTLLF
jgi:hypothetical protein